MRVEVERAWRDVGVQMPPERGGRLLSTMIPVGLGGTPVPGPRPLLEST